MTTKTMVGEKKHTRPLPSGWRWVRLGDPDVASVIMGQSPPSSTYTEEPVGLPFYQGKADFGELHSVPTIWCTSPNRIAEPGDILLSVRAPVGPTNIANERCCIGRGLAAIRPKQESLLSYYLLAVLRYLEPELARSGSGSTFSAIVREQVETISFPLPPLDEQRAITTRLEAQMAEVQRMRQAAERQLEAAQALQGAVLRQVFRHKEGDPLPPGWRWVRLGEVCQVNPSRPPNFQRAADAPTTFVPMEAVDGQLGSVLAPQTRPYQEVERGYTFFQVDDIIFAKITPCMENGKAAIGCGLIDGIAFGSTEFHVLRPGPNILPKFVWHFVRQPDFRAEAARRFVGAVGQQRVPSTFVENAWMPLPPLSEQRAMVARLESQMAEVQRLCAAAERQLEAIHALPGALLNEVFGGYEQE